MGGGGGLGIRAIPQRKRFFPLTPSLMLSLLRLCLLSNPCFLLHITPTLRPPPIHFLPPNASLSVDAKVPLTFNATLAFMSFLSPTLITIRSQSSCCISAFVRMASFAPYWRSVLQSNFEIALAFALSFPPTGGVLALCASYLPYLWYKKCSNLLLKLFITILSNQKPKTLEDLVFYIWMSGLLKAIGLADGQTWHPAKGGRNAAN